MNVSEQVTQVIESLCEKLGIAADYVYPLLIKQAKIDGYLALIYILFGLGAIAAFLMTARYYFKPLSGGETRWERIYLTDAELWAIVVLVAMGLVAGTGFFIALGNIGVAVRALVNPEWYALQEIIQQILP